MGCKQNAKSVGEEVDMEALSLIIALGGLISVLPVTGSSPTNEVTSQKSVLSFRGLEICCIRDKSNVYIKNIVHE